MADRTRLTVSQRMEVLALLARGDTHLQIVNYLKETYKLEYTISSVATLKSAHKKTIREMQEKMLDATSADAETVMKRARAQLYRKLDKADRDSNQIDELDEQYRAGEITKDEYRQKKHGLLQLSISELTRIGAAMHQQSKTDPLPPETPTLPDGNQPRSASLPAGGQFETLLTALQSGDTVALQQIIFRKGETNDKPHVVQNAPA